MTSDLWTHWSGWDSERTGVTQQIGLLSPNMKSVLSEQSARTKVELLPQLSNRPHFTGGGFRIDNPVRRWPPTGSDLSGVNETGPGVRWVSASLCQKAQSVVCVGFKGHWWLLLHIQLRHVANLPSTATAVMKVNVYDCFENPRPLRILWLYMTTTR